MNLSPEYHNRQHYETMLKKLHDMAAKNRGYPPLPELSRLSNIELLIQINNHLAYFNAETYSLYEMEDIAAALQKNKLKIQ